MSDRGATRITELEIVEAPRGFDSKQTLLHILKSKGAPVEGSLYLKPSRKYVWSETQDLWDGTILVTWEKIPDKKTSLKEVYIDMPWSYWIFGIGMIAVSVLAFWGAMK